MTTTIIKATGVATTNAYLRSLRTGMMPAIDRAANKEAQALRREMVMGLRNQSPGGKKIKPISDMTRKLRGLPKAGSKSASRKRRKARLGPSKALIVGGDLIGSIAVQKHGSGSYTVGVHRGAVGRKNRGDMEHLAAVHEYGSKKYTVTVTPKMAAFSRFLVVMKVLNVPWHVGQTLKKQTPARPFLNPAHKVWIKHVQERFEISLMQQLLAGQLK
jgi:hypothetical protein